MAYEIELKYPPAEQRNVSPGGTRKLWEGQGQGFNLLDPYLNPGIRLYKRLGYPKGGDQAGAGLEQFDAGSIRVCRWVSCTSRGS